MPYKVFQNQESQSSVNAIKERFLGDPELDMILRDYRTCDENRIAEAMGRISYRLSLRLARDPIWYGALKLRATERSELGETDLSNALDTALLTLGESPEGVLMVLRNAKWELRVLLSSNGSAVALIEGGTHWLGREAVKLAGCMKGNVTLYKIGGRK